MDMLCLTVRQSCFLAKLNLSLLVQPLQELLPILDDESKTAKTTDATLITECDTIHRKHPNYEVAKLSYPAFSIQHYAGTVSCCK